MTYTVSGANFNKDVAAQGTSINYKENKAVKSEGVAGSRHLPLLLHFQSHSQSYP